jgi:hypothetical protein
MSVALTPDDDGKRVLTPDGRVVGHIDCTDDGAVLVRPCPEFVAHYGSLLTSCWNRDEGFRLNESAVTAVEDDAVRIGPR